MSRSIKYPVFKDKANKYIKRLASKAVRRAKNLENYKGYSYLKKLFDPYNISDYRFFPIDENQEKIAKRK